MKLHPQSPLRRLMEHFPEAGRVEWIGVRPSAHEALVEVTSAHAIAGRGLEGDHRARSRASSKRQVTLIQAEHIAVLGRLLRTGAVGAGLLRRNVVVSGINLLALKDRLFVIGEVVLEGTGACAPCSRMEVNLGPGGYNAMRGHGGITARVVTGGVLRIADEVRVGGIRAADLLSEF